MRSIFPDQRADPLTAPRRWTQPASTWTSTATASWFSGHGASPAPWRPTALPCRPGPQIRLLQQLHPEQAIGLYPTDGTTDDFGYGDLGVASYTFELGTNFFQDCSTFENTILPDNLQALVYAAKVSAPRT